MEQNGIEKRPGASLVRKGQYALPIAAIGLLLFISGFPVFLLFFIGVLSYFVWKVFSSEGRAESRHVFEFYLVANEVLRGNSRRWYGFEVKECIDRGEEVCRAMPEPPPLVHFTLGALYNKLGQYNEAVRHLSAISEDRSVEIAIVYPDRELRQYVKTLRKIERDPAEAPQIASAVRSLERARKSRSAALLAESIQMAEKPVEVNPENIAPASAVRIDQPQLEIAESVVQPAESLENDKPNAVGSRQTISEVLHDIYDSGPH